MGQVYTNSIKYIPGEYAYTNGHKGNECDHFNDSTGAYVKQKGYGWASEWKPSKIIVSIETEDGCFDVWVDRYFRENVHIMTTGNGVFSDTDQSVADLFKRAYINEQNGYQAGDERRSPLMWTNYPTVDASP